MVRIYQIKALDESFLLPIQNQSRVNEKPKDLTL